MLKLNRKGLTLVELLVVMLIIAILIAISATQYNKYISNSKYNSVEQDLSGWLSDINQYIEDYGPLKIDKGKVGITNFNEYRSYLCYGIVNSGLPVSKEFSDFASNSLLNIFQSYCTNAFMIEKIEEDEGDISLRNVILTTKYKRDPWGQKFKILCDTEKGTIVVVSAGPDNIYNYKKYKNEEFGDDILLVVNPKE